MLRVFLMSVGLIVFSGVLKAQPLSYTIYKTGALVIDGNLSDWGSIPFTPDFVIHNTSAAALRNTKAKMLWDNNNLYVAFQVTDQDMKGSLVAHDASIFNSDDLIEVFLDFDGNGTNYIELGVSVINTSYDFIIICPAASCGGWQSNTAWNITGFQSAVQRTGTVNNAGDTDVGWNIEMQIPFSGLATATGSGFSIPAASTHWRGNLFRIDYSTPVAAAQEYQAWSPYTSFGFHQPASFGHFYFSDALPLEEEPGIITVNGASESLKVYPNPAHDNVSIELPPDAQQLILYNSMGEIMYSEILKEDIVTKELSLSSFAVRYNDFLMLAVITGGKSYYKKLIIE